jgi:hypothetical protein
MKTFIRMVLLVPPLVGCATKVAGLRSSPDFTYGNLTRGRILVGGVAVASGAVDEANRNSLAGLLRTALLEERKEVPVGPVGIVPQKLGKLYPTVVGEIELNGTLSEKSIEALRSKVTDTRYITFARVENDQVSQDRREVSNTDRNGNPIPGSAKVVTSAERAVTASLTVYDLKSGNIAWSGSVTKSLSQSREYEKEREIGLVTVIRAIKGDTANQTPEQKYPYPSPPETNKVLARVFAGFAENFPEKD